LAAAGIQGLTGPDKFLTLLAMAKDGRAVAAQGMVPSTYVRLLYEYLERRGLDAKKLLQSPPPEAVDRGLGRYPVEHWRRLLEQAAVQLDDPLLGLHLGRSITPAHFGVIGYVLLACGNLGAALQRLQQYQRLVYDVNPMRYRFDKNTVVLEWGVEQGRPGALRQETPQHHGENEQTIVPDGADRGFVGRAVEDTTAVLHGVTKGPFPHPQQPKADGDEPARLPTFDSQGASDPACQR